jgi:serine phosphatase RsbU (regulator of sigma subunit)
VPKSARWHHARCQPSAEKTRVDKEEEEEKAPVSAEEKNKALVRRFLEEVSRGNISVIDELLSPDFVDRSLLPGQGPTREDFKRSVAEILDAFSTISFTIEEQIAEGDTVVTKYTERSVIRGEFGGLPPTGTEEMFEGIYLHRISDDKIIEEWSQANTLHSTLERLEQETRERARVEQDLRVARNIQQASLPKAVPKLEGWLINPFYQPARKVGGDFYDFFDLEDGRLGLVVGDATGKGVSAALVMASARSMLHALAQASDYSPGKVLRMTNDPLVTDIPPNMFVTCFYAILDPKSGSLSYANAGHDLPYLHRNSAAEELRATGMPLGLMPGMGYEEKEAILEAGEAALFYSDGLVEAHDPKGEMFGFPRLRELVAEHGEERSLGDFLMEELYSFAGEGWEQEDDITLLTLRCSAARS